MRVGRRLVIRPTWRRHRRAPDDVVLALDPGMAFGTGLHPTTRLCLAALEALADAASLAGARVLDVGCGSGILAIAAVQARRGDRARRRHRPDRDRGDGRQRAAQRARPAGPGARGQPAQRRGRRSTSCSPTSSRACSSRSRRPSRDELRPGGTLLASGIFIDREARGRAAFEAAGLAVADRIGGGRLGRLSRRSGGSLDAAPALQSRRDARVTSRSCSSPTSSWPSASSCRRSCCRSRCGRGGRRSSRRAASSGRCCGRRRTARSRSGSGWR